MKHEIRRALWTAGALIGVALLLKWMSNTGAINGDVSERLIQVAIGVVLVVTANFVPKQLSKISEDGCEPSRRQSLQRFTGWAFVLAGIAYAIIWIAAPMDVAFVASVCVIGATMLLVLVPCVWLLLRRSRVRQASKP
jgi:uncharacterized membrane protein